MQHTLRTGYCQNGHPFCVHIPLPGPLGQQLLSSRPILWSSKPRAALALRGTAVLLGGPGPAQCLRGWGHRVAPRMEAAPGPPAAGADRAPSWQGAAGWCAGKSNQAIMWQSLAAALKGERGFGTRIRVCIKVRGSRTSSGAFRRRCSSRC